MNPKLVALGESLPKRRKITAHVIHKEEKGIRLIKGSFSKLTRPIT